MANTSRPDGSLSPTARKIQQLLSSDAEKIFTIVDVVVLSELISVFGILTNVVTMVVLVKQGFKKTINVSLMGMAVSDFLSLASLACLCVGNNPWLIESNVPFDPISVFYLTTGWPNTVFARVTGWITAYINVERCLCVAMPLKIKRLLTHGRCVIVMVAIYLGVIAGVCPIYFTTGLHWRFDSAKNRSVITLNFIGANREEIKRVALGITNIFSPFTSFGLVIVCTMVLAVKLKSKSKWRQSVTRDLSNVKVPLQDKEKATRNEGVIKKGNSDKKVFNTTESPAVTKDAKVIKLVVVLSTVYIVSSLPSVLHFAWMILDPEYTVVGQQNNVHLSVAGVTFVCQATYSSVTLFVYMYMSASFRDTFYSQTVVRRCLGKGHHEKM